MISVDDLPESLKNEEKSDLIFYMQLGKNLFDKSSLIVEPTIDDIFDSSNNKSSAKIGLSGEKYVESLLESEWCVKNVRAKGRCGDLQITKNSDSNETILIEVKKYSGFVQYKEVEKFYRDLDANSQIKAGVLISLTSKISGIKDTIKMSNFKGKPVIFIQTSEPNIIRQGISLIFTVLDSTRIVDAEIYNKLEQKVHKMCEQLNQLSLARTYISETRQVMQKQLDKIYETILISEKSLNKTLRSITKLVEKSFYSHQVSEVSNIDELIKKLSEYAKEYMFGKTKIHQELLTEVFEKLLPSDQEIIIDFSKKETAINNKQIKLRFFKSKTEIHLEAPHDEVVIVPKGLMYNGEYLVYIMDKNYTKNHIHELVINLKT